MNNKPRVGTRTVSGLRTRFFPKSRVGHGLVSVAPWIDIVILMILFVVLDSKFVLRPGIVVEPPSASYLEGSQSDLLAVIKSINSIDSNRKEEIVFFDNKRFVVNNSGQMKKLQESMRIQSEKYRGQDLVIISDKTVNHGTIVRMFNLAHNASITNINIAVRSEN